MKLELIKSKKVAIWGFGVEGKAVANYLLRHKISFSVLCKSHETEGDYNYLTQEITTDVLNRFDIIIKSPGISPYSERVKLSTAYFTSPTALWFANEKKTQVIAVTGTKGKSTTVSLLAHILKKQGKSVNLVGNIGQALISSHSNYDYIVLEASSFQIYDGNIQADIAVICNLFSEHIDWHQGKNNYFNDKLKLLDKATIKILNAENATLNSLCSNTEAIYFNTRNNYHINGNSLYKHDTKLIQLSEIQLLGWHNLENCAAVLTVCDCLQLNTEQCINAIKSFKPLSHRLQNLGTIAGFHAINDSIATTPVATLAALATVDLSKTTLFVGGYDRGYDWCDFVDSLAKIPMRLMILSGQNAKKIHDLLKNKTTAFNYILCNNLTEAIKTALQYSNTGDTLLLSPGAPSFDQFDSYIKRGEFFEEELKRYEN